MIFGFLPCQSSVRRVRSFSLLQHFFSPLSLFCSPSILSPHLTMPNLRTRLGVTLPEIVVTLLLIGILTALAAPAMNRWVSVSRTRASLDQISAELMRARMLAVESGHRISLLLRSADGCIVSVRTHEPGDPDAPSVGHFVDTATVCLRHSGDSILTFNSRGMLHPPARSIFPADPTLSDSLLLSSAGRIRRNY